jgi:hypothetical protein
MPLGYLRRTAPVTVTQVFGTRTLIVARVGGADTDTVDALISISAGIVIFAVATLLAYLHRLSGVGSRAVYLVINVRGQRDIF